MMLTSENYFSQEAQIEYFGSSQIKQFMKCEAQAMAELRGEYVPEKSTALLVGSYVDAHFEGTLDLFQAHHPELFRRDGTLKSEFIQAEDIIARCEQDPLFMEYMSGEKQKILTAELFGYKFKIKIDSYLEDRAIVDQKVMKDFEKIYVEGMGKVNFIEAWGYDIQGAIYQKVEQIATERKKPLPFILACATKQRDGADLGLFQIPQYKLDAALKVVEANIDYIAAVKQGLAEPIRCEKCTYCRQTKVLSGVKILEDIDNE